MIKAIRVKNRWIYGWTLIELIIVMTIIAILAVIALPNIGTLVQASQRQLMQAELLRLAHQLEQNYQVTNGYTRIETPPFPSSEPLYRVTLLIESDGQNFRLTATPINEQVGDGALVIESDGSKRHYTNDKIGGDFALW